MALAAVTEDVASVFRASVTAAVMLGEGVDGRHLVLSDPELGVVAERHFLEQMHDQEGWLARLRQIGFRFVSNDADPAELPAGWGRRFGTDETARLLAVPFLVRGAVLGGLVIARGREEYPFDEGDVWLAESIADVLALSIGVAVHSYEMNQFFAASLELLCMVDFGGRLHRLNPQWDRVLGYDPQELDGATFLDLVHPEDRPSTAAAFRDLGEARVPAQFVNRFRARDGSYRSLEWLARPGTDLIYASGRDITDRLAQERALRESETRLQDLVSTSRRSSAASRKKSAAARRWGSCFRRRPGASPPCSPRWRSAGRGARALVSENLHKDGHDVALLTACAPIFHSEGEFSGFRDVDKDVTLREKLDCALQESEERYRLIVDNVAAVIWVLDLEAMKFTYISPSVERLRGYTPDEVLTQSLEQVLTPESHQRVLATLREALARAAAGEITIVESLEIEQPRKDGGTVETEITTTLLPGPDGRPAQILGVSRDISKRKAAERALQVSRKRLEDLMFVVGDWIWEADAEFRFTQCSDGVRGVLGYEPDEVIGKTPMDFMPLREGEEMRELRSRAGGQKGGLLRGGESQPPP